MNFSSCMFNIKFKFNKLFLKKLLIDLGWFIQKKLKKINGIPYNSIPIGLFGILHFLQILNTFLSSNLDLSFSNNFN